MARLPHSKQQKRKPGEEKPKEPRKLRLEPTGEHYRGAVVRSVIRSGQRVAVWAPGAGLEDDPVLVGVLLGRLCDRTGEGARHAFAVNGRTVEVPEPEAGYMTAVAGHLAHPEVGV